MLDVQIAALLALEVGIFLCKRIPYIGFLAHPVVRSQPFCWTLHVQKQ